MSEVCVIGGGPAGSTFAARMAQLGHRVSLFERSRFPRAHLGESLSPGVLPLLETIGARKSVENASFTRVRQVQVKWEGELHLREDPREEGLLVDRSEFDQLLLERAQSLGVRVHFGEWTNQFRADFTADARGRSSPVHKRRTGCRTVALYGYWQGRDLPRQPRIEAGKDAWYWGVPLPGGGYNTLIFVDTHHFRADRPSFHHLLEASGLMAGCVDAHLTGPIRAMDATASLDEESVTLSSIRVGDAALAIDPISSSGVQKAIQTALAGAVVANTLLRKPDRSQAARNFYRANLAEASERHSRWAASHYASVAANLGGKFWEDRARFAESNLPVSSRIPVNLNASVQLSPQFRFVELPCIEGDFVVSKSAVYHPDLPSPVAYLGGRELVPLLHRLPPNSTPLQIAQSWQNRIPFEAGLAIAAWLCDHGVLSVR